ncbi:lytic transglycosylase domain-containing protein [Paracraurococcus lichenis]|uniref:Lytic transglycosylase domain-containing protein n=1 Tax=Paracraurococcus lichenis TaxID=3064888 RepID=A0ABT9DYZ3_9PROT|nr:lytic transglycosylase domain-containing protein [Paracraurococcus sp. LOR1-02]MDO9709130.1 lytic transglycosylase domain-containing protein [Paracraurococcus sp. LOR1-02]
MAEREAALPPGLLQAIARTESGRRDPATGRIEPWPWALNAGGLGLLAATREEAIATVAALQARGLRSIDVGCLQVNLLHHPAAFASLEEAFEPLANARYAARFLRELQARAGGAWEQAVAWYHSATPERGEAYRLRVMAALAGGSGVLPSLPAPPAPRADPVAPLLAPAAWHVRVIVPLPLAAPGTAGPAPARTAPLLPGLPRVVTPRGG